MDDNVRRKSLSFEEYWRASKAWEQKGLTLGTARALVNAGFLTVEDLRSVPYWELASIPRVGAKSLAILHELMWRKPETSEHRRPVEPAAPRPAPEDDRTC